MGIEEIRIKLDDLIHDTREVEITIPTALTFIEAQQKEIEELIAENKAFYKMITFKNITKLQERVKELEEEILNNI